MYNWAVIRECDVKHKYAIVDSIYIGYSLDFTVTEINSCTLVQFISTSPRHVMTLLIPQVWTSCRNIPLVHQVPITVSGYICMVSLNEKSLAHLHVTSWGIYCIIILLRMQNNRFYKLLESTFHLPMHNHTKVTYWLCLLSSVKTK